VRDVELRILHEITCTWASPFADGLARFVNDGWFGPALFALVWLALLLSAARRPRAVRVLVAAVLTLGIVHGIRWATWKTLPRPRPGQTFAEGRILRGAWRETCASHPDMWVERDYPPKSPSFPSSHAVTAGAVAAALGFGFRWLAAPAWLFAALVAWGRLYWGKHWPSDVVGSLLLSLLVGWLVWRLLPRRRSPFPGRLAGSGAAPPASDARG
jgi:membrane-associated phospholipid phosphatase